MNLRQIYYSLSPEWRRTARRLYYLPVDIWESATGQKKGLRPPKGKIFTGSGDFEKEGKAFLKYFQQFGDLQPHHRVLDIGSGIGRMAIPLTEFLSTEGSYEGFDIVEEGVVWCQKHITAQYPNFHFQQVHLSNDLYRDTGDSAVDFSFPYSDDQFNFCFLTSVFTHMLPEQVDNYLSEINRVLVKGGRCLSTFFLLNGEVEQRIKDRNHFNFPYDYGHYKLMDDQVKSANVAFDITFIEQIAYKNNLSIQNVHPGFWSGLEKEQCLDFQDIIVFEKE